MSDIKKYPKYISVISKTNKRGSHMFFDGDRYSTYGWALPLANIEYDTFGRYYIVDFMEHLNGRILEPINEETYELDEWEETPTFEEDAPYV